MNYTSTGLVGRLPTHPDLCPDDPRVAARSHGRVMALVVTHNRLHQLRRTLQRLLANPEAHMARVIVVDNASTDATAAYLRSIKDARLTIVQLTDNIGGAGGFRVGIDHAVTRFDPDWLVVMDDDARPAPDAIAQFHDSDLRGWDAVAAAAYHLDGRICDINRPSRDPFRTWRSFLRTLCMGRNGFHLGQRDYATQQAARIDTASFVGLFLSRRGLRLMGLPRADLFIYSDDSLQTLTLSRNGGQMAFFPSIRFEHDTDTLSGNQAQTPFWKVYYQHRNALILYRETAGWAFWLVAMIVIPRWLLRVRAYRGKRRRFLALFLRAVWHGLRGKTDVPHRDVLAWANAT